MQTNGSHDHFPRTRIQDLVRDQRIQWKFSGNVRLHGVWLLCLSNWQSILPERQSLRFINAFLDDLWGRFSYASPWCSGSGSLHRPSRASSWLTSYVGPDVLRDLLDRLRARLRNDRPHAPPPRSDRPLPSTIFP